MEIKDLSVGDKVLVDYVGKRPATVYYIFTDTYFWFFKTRTVFVQLDNHPNIIFNLDNERWYPRGN